MHFELGLLYGGFGWARSFWLRSPRVLLFHRHRSATRWNPVGPVNWEALPLNFLLRPFDLNSLQVIEFYTEL